MLGRTPLLALLSVVVAFSPAVAENNATDLWRGSNPANDNLVYKKAGAIWKEYHRDGAEFFADWQEQNRDATTVTLYDPARKYTLKLTPTEALITIPDQGTGVLIRGTWHAAPVQPTGGLRVMTYNAYLIEGVAGVFGAAPSRPERAQAIGNADFMRGQDVVILNELFDDSAGQKLLAGLSGEYPHQTPIVGKSKQDAWDSSEGQWKEEDLRIRGGVAIVSKWPIERKVQYIFNSRCNEDAMAMKGFAYVKINRNGTPIHIVGTHLQAETHMALPGIASCSEPTIGETTYGWSTREGQCREIQQFISSQRIPANELVLIGGDLNVIQSLKEYDSMLSALQALPPTGFTGHYASHDPANSLITEPGAGAYEESAQRLDYILVERNHLTPATWYNHVLQPKPNAPVGGKGDYSDHYPVLATIEAQGSAAAALYPYVISLKTGTKTGLVGEETAGTDSQVKLRIHGSGGVSPWFIAADPLEGGFGEAGQTNEFCYSLPALGTVTALEVYKDGSGAGADWFLESVSVKAQGKEVNWITGDWIQSGTRMLNLGNKVKYTIVLQTGSKSGTFGEEQAGTDSEVKLRLHGSKGQSELVLAASALQKGYFEARQTNQFEYNFDDLGDVSRLEIVKDGSGGGPDWWLQTVKVGSSTGVKSWTGGTWIESGTSNINLR